MSDFHFSTDYLDEDFDCAGEEALPDDLSCDFDNLPQEPPTLLPRPSDPWLRRRSYHFGASEVAALLIALDRRPADAFGSIPRRQSKRLLKRKAGLAKPLKVTPEMERGTQLEADLFAEWMRGDLGLIARDTVQYVEGLDPVLRCLSPAVDHECPELAASLDVLCLDLFGRLGVVDLKCSFKAYEQTKARHVVQLHAQMAVTGAEWGRIVEGVRWANPYFDGGSQPVRTHEVIERNDALVEEIRDACREGWAAVEKLREEANG